MYIYIAIQGFNLYLKIFITSLNERLIEGKIQEILRTDIITN